MLDELRSAEVLSVWYHGWYLGSADAVSLLTAGIHLDLALRQGRAAIEISVTGSNAVARAFEKKSAPAWRQ